MMKSVSLLGKGKGWRDAPCDVETWGITQQLSSRPISRIVDMNNYALWGKLEAKRDVLSRERAAEMGIPYYDLVTYPYKEVTEFFGTDYFSNTVDFALALAIYEGYDDIHLWGVTMEMESEYAYQKPGVDFWCGVAIGRGVKITVHGSASRIMKTQDGLVYGYGFPQRFINAD